MPVGAEVALLDGIPATEGSFTVRLKVSAGYKIPVQFFRHKEIVTLISGEMHVRALNEKNTLSVSAGGFFIVPAQVRHESYLPQESILQVTSLGI